jgi:hypothetical protein
VTDRRRRLPRIAVRSWRAHVRDVARPRLATAGATAPARQLLRTVDLGDGSPALRIAGLPKDRSGPPRLPGCPLAACRASRPRRVRSPLPVPTQRTLSPSASMDPWAPGTVIGFEANSHGPLARAPTLRRRRYRRRRKARFRRGRAHPSPGGSRTRWTADEGSWSHRIFHSSSTSSAWSHHPAYDWSRCLNRPVAHMFAES